MIESEPTRHSASHLKVVSHTADTPERNQHSQNLVRSLEDAENARVTQKALVRVVFHEAHPAHYLDAFVDTTERRLRAHDFANGGFNVAVGIAAVDHARCHVRNTLAGVCVRSHVRKLVRNQLEFRQWPAKLSTGEESGVSMTRG